MSVVISLYYQIAGLRVSNAGNKFIFRRKIMKTLLNATGIVPLACILLAVLALICVSCSDSNGGGGGSFEESGGVPLVGAWYYSSTLYQFTPMYEFTADGQILINGFGNIYYTASDNTINTYTVSGSPIGTEIFSISGNTLTLSAGSGERVLSPGTYTRP
jgi:hypothetical protein